MGLRKMQEDQLAYYTIRAPFDGVVGDIPVHVGDYVTSSTMLTTVDRTGDLEAYIYLPTERSSEARIGLAVELSDTSGKLLEKSRMRLPLPASRSDAAGHSCQGTGARDARNHAERAAHQGSRHLEHEADGRDPGAGGDPPGRTSFVFVAKKGQDGHFVATRTPVTLGDTVGNTYSITSGLSAGDQVIVSSTQFLVNGMPVSPLGA